MRPSRFTVRSSTDLHNQLETIKARLGRMLPGCKPTTADAIRFAIAEAADPRPAGEGA